MPPLFTTPPSPHCNVCVVIPVKNEAATLTAALQALTQQVDGTGRPLDHSRYEILLLVNNCSDDSIRVVRRFARQHLSLALHSAEMTLAPPDAHVGRARQLLMDEAYQRLISVGRRRGIIVSTDGDTRVAPTWIATILDEIASGTDAVSGRVLTDGAGRLALDSSTRAYYLRDLNYQYLVAALESWLDPDPSDPWPRHFQHTGASLAVTAEMYARAGGLPPLPSSEDIALYQALMRTGARFRHSPQLWVHTSTRRQGRAPHGMAAQLDTWHKMAMLGLSHLVEPVTLTEARVRSRQQLRTLWRCMQVGQQPSPSALASVADTLQIAIAWLTDQLARLQPFALLLAHIEAYQQRQDGASIPQARVDIRTAIAELRLRLSELRRAKTLDRHGHTLSFGDIQTAHAVQVGSSMALSAFE